MDIQANNNISVWTPVCKVCKASNETLRAVSYPYVVSVIFMTFQRAFSGVFCAKHQRRYHLLASLITSMAGWIGIPFGFIMTPIALFRLARGGVTDDRQNVRLLSLLAEKKLREGDTQGAIRCLEECIKLQDIPEIRGRLANLYQFNRPPTEMSGWERIRQFLSVPVLLIISSLLGALIGFLDLLLAILLAPLYKDNNANLFVAILSWLPTVTMLFFGILTVRALLRWSLAKNKRAPILLGSILAYLSTFLAFYSVLQGQALVLSGMTMFFAISPKDGIFAIRSVLAHGGVDALINNFNQADLPSVIFASLLIAAIGLSLFVGLEMVLHTVKGQQRLLQIRESLSMESENPAFFAWGTLSVMVLGLLVFLALAFPGNYVNIENAYHEINQGMSELDRYQPEGAVNHFKKVVNSWPTSVTGHVYLGLGYGSQDKFDQAAEEFDTALKLDANSAFAHFLKASVLVGQSRFFEAVNEYNLVAEAQPTWGFPHANLALIYYMLDKNEEENAEIQQALKSENTDGQTYSSIGSYYLTTQNFSKAEEYYLKAIDSASDPGSADYLTLARVYISQNNFDKAEKIIEEARTRGADPVNVYLAKISMVEFQNRYDRASSLIAEAMKSYPDRSDLYSEKSFIEFQQGHIDTAASDAEQAIELNPYNSHAYVELAYAYHSQGKLKEALEMAQKAAALIPKYDRAYYVLGLCYKDLGMKEEAIGEFEKFLNVYWERPFVKDYKENVVLYLEQLK